MGLVFFVSSMGDTELANNTINKLIEQNLKNPIFVIPLTSVAEKQTEKFAESKQITRVTLEKILLQNTNLSKKQFTQEELLKIALFIASNNIQRAFIGVPSPLDENLPFQIAQHLKIPCTIAYEYMFTAPKTHCFWDNINGLVNNGNCNFAVPFEIASKEILAVNKKANITTIGHCSVDRGLLNENIDASPTKKLLQINDSDELIFASGTTQSTEIDNQFLDALLQEMVTGNYPRIQLRFGIHPGVKELDSYLNTLLTTSAKYSSLCSQFKIILPSQLEKRLQLKINDEQNKFILRTGVSGAQAAQAAGKIAQAVPGALLNESALKGKPSYFHNKSSSPYLPKTWFSESISAFFAAKPQPPHTKEELGLKMDAPSLMSEVMMATS